VLAVFIVVQGPAMIRLFTSDPATIAACVHVSVFACV
jgi:hypothetical protein